MGLAPHEQRQQDEMQKDIKSLLRSAADTHSRLSVVETNVGTLLGDKKRAIGFALAILSAAIIGLGSWLWAIITAKPHP